MFERPTDGAPGVYYATPVFGFITDVPPRIIKGQFATDASGVPLSPVPGFQSPPPSDSSAFEIVAPTNIGLVDPVPDLLSGSKVTTFAKSLATKGRPVQGLAADGVTEVLLRLPAGNKGDRFTLSLIQGSGSTDEDGALGKPGDTEFSLSTLTVTAVDTHTSEGAMAFAIYRAPLDFPRATGQDASASIKLQIQLIPKDSSATVTTSLDITILRPLVVLVHGLWSAPSAWNNFDPLWTSNGQDQRFAIKRADYTLIVGSIDATVPQYPDPSVLSQADGSSLGFHFNATEVRDQVVGFLNEFEAGNNPLQIQAAAVKADIVAHSMGGNIARYMASLNDFFSPDTYGQGIIHKIITIGTPHLGSPLAIDLLPDLNSQQDPNKCVRNILAGRGLVSFSSVTLTSGPETGAVGDLRGDGLGGSRSQALITMDQPGPHLLSVALIAGTTAPINLNDLGWTGASLYIRARCFGNPIAGAMNRTDWDSLFGQENDGVVPLSSQQLQLSGDLIPGLIHTSSLTSLGFIGPGELDAGSHLADVVIGLLNKPVTNAHFHPLNP